MKRPAKRSLANRRCGWGRSGTVVDGQSPLSRPTGIRRTFRERGPECCLCATGPGTSERDLPCGLLLRHSSLRKSQHCHSLDLRWLLAAAPDTPAATVSGGVQQQRAREGAAPGLGGHLRHRSHAGLAGTPRPVAILHTLCVNNMSVAWMAALAPHLASGTDRAVHELMASPRDPNPIPPGS